VRPSAGVIRAKHTLPGSQDLFVQRDRLGHPARGAVGLSEIVPRVQGLEVIRAEHPLQILGQRLANRDRLPRAVAQPVQEVQRPQPQARQEPGQLIIALTARPGRDVPQRRHLLRPKQASEADVTPITMQFFY